MNSSFPCTRDDTDEIRERFQESLLDQALFAFEDDGDDGVGEETEIPLLLSPAARRRALSFSPSTPTLTPSSISTDSGGSLRTLKTPTTTVLDLPKLPLLHAHETTARNREEEEEEEYGVLLFSPSPATKTKKQQNLKLHLPKIPSRGYSVPF
jgi:hypothetical protein